MNKFKKKTLKSNSAQLNPNILLDSNTHTTSNKFKSFKTCI